MKTNFNLILISFLIFFSFTNKVSSEDRIVYLDMQKVMNISKAGKSITSQLEKKHKKNINNFKKEEEELKSEESNSNCYLTAEYAEIAEVKRASLRPQRTLRFIKCLDVFERLFWDQKYEIPNKLVYPYSIDLSPCFVSG